MAYIGKAPDSLVTGQSTSEDIFTATANQTVFTLTSDVTTETDIVVAINGVVQSGTAYGMSGTGNRTLTFTAGLTVGDSVRVLHIGFKPTTTIFADGTVTTPKLADNSVTSAKIAVDVIVAEDIAANAITVSELQNNAVTTAKIIDDAVTTAKILNANVTTAKLAADAVDGTKLADNACNSEHYTDGSIDTAHIANAQITTALIADDAVTAAKIADDTINSEHYAAASIDNEHLADDAVGVAELSATGTASSSTFLRGDNAWAAAGGGAWTFISETVASSSATISITSGITSTYDMYMIVITNIEPATDDSELRMTVSTDGGSSYRTSGYRETASRHGPGSARDDYVNSGATSLLILAGSATSESLSSSNRDGSVTIYIPNPSDAGEKTQIWWIGGYHTAGNEQMTIHGTGCYDSAAEDLDAVRFQMESGNISTGNFALYGLKNS